jgi:DNA invertase Pin-like site-specific DNA recombinase
MNYILYARKSTEEDDRQIMSIEAQLAELREFARRENLTIVKEYQESKSAKSRDSQPRGYTLAANFEKSPSGTSAISSLNQVTKLK